MALNGAEEPKPLRWGILGAARIAGKALIPAIRKAGGEVAAIAASSAARAESFARDHGIPEACGGYERLLADPKIEAVYIPLANGLHYDWAMKTAAAGKACICEKPLVLTASEASALRAAFSRSGARLQEAFMWRHHAQIRWLLDEIAAGRLGELQRIHATFSFTLDRPDDYRWKSAHGGGALWDIGCYCVNAARLFFGVEPKTISATAHLRPKPDDVDESAAAWLDFGEGRMATLSCSFRAAFAQGIELIGREGRAWIATPWLQVDRPAHVVIERDNARTVQDFAPMNSYAVMVKEFTRAVRDPKAPLWPGEDGAAQARAMEALLRAAHSPGSPPEQL